MSSDLFVKIETPSITYEQPIGLYIDGKWVKGKEGKTFETINPTNEKPIVAVHEAGPDGTLLAPPPACELTAEGISLTPSAPQMSTLRSLRRGKR